MLYMTCGEQSANMVAKAGVMCAGDCLPTAKQSTENLAGAVPAMMPAIWLTALFGAAFGAGLLGPAAAPSVEGPAAAGLGALLANEGSCLASRHLTALHL